MKMRKRGKLQDREWKEPERSECPHPGSGRFTWLEPCGSPGLYLSVYTMRRFAKERPKDHSRGFGARLLWSGRAHRRLSSDPWLPEVALFPPSAGATPSSLGSFLSDLKGTELGRRPLISDPLQGRFRMQLR
jgi:hypothetical protein